MLSKFSIVTSRNHKFPHQRIQTLVMRSLAYFLRPRILEIIDAEKFSNQDGILKKILSFSQLLGNRFCQELSPLPPDNWGFSTKNKSLHSSFFQIFFLKWYVRNTYMRINNSSCLIKCCSLMSLQKSSYSNSNGLFKVSSGICCQNGNKSSFMRLIW